MQFLMRLLCLFTFSLVCFLVFMIFIPVTLPLLCLYIVSLPYTIIKGELLTDFKEVLKLYFMWVSFVENILSPK